MTVNDVKRKLSTAGRTWTCLLAILWTAALPISAQTAEAELRIVDEMAPPGGLAVLVVELTEPQPITEGEICVRVPPSPVLKKVQNVALLSRSAQVAGSATISNGVIDVQFTSPTSNFGIDADVPLMVIAIPVSSQAQPGQTVDVTIDLSRTTLLAPDGSTYPLSVKNARITVGGVSITGLQPASGNLSAGAQIVVQGVGFQSEVEIDFNNAAQNDPVLMGSTEAVVTLTAPFQLSPITRVRVRNPDDTEDLFYPAALLPGLATNDPPFAQADSADTFSATGVEIDVLGNDSDPNGNALSLLSVSQPSNGSAAILGIGTILYQPDPDFVGSDTFDYTVGDGLGGTANATVTVAVSPALIFPEASLTLPLGGLGEVEVELFSSSDAPVELTASDPNLVRLSPAQPPLPGQPTVGFRLVGTDLGQGEIVARQGPNSVSIPLEVVKGSVLRIPVLRNDSSTRVGLALINTSPDDSAQVRLTGLTPAPSGEAEISLSLTLVLEPGEQRARFLQEYDPGFDGFQGWVEVSSLQEGVEGVFLNLPQGRLIYAGGSLSDRVSGELILPVPHSSDPEATEVSIVHPNLGAADLDIEWIGADGQSKGVFQSTLDGHDSLAASLQAFFPSGEQSAEGYLIVRSTDPVVAYLQVLTPEIILGEIGRSAPSMPGSLHVPQFVGGSGLSTQLSVINLSDQLSEVQISLLGDDGNLIVDGLTTNPVTLELPAGGEMTVEGDELFGRTGGLIVGSLLLESASPLVGTALISRPSDPSFLTTQPVSAQGAREVVFAQAASGDFNGVILFTGLALQNSNQEPATVEIFVHDSSGSLLGQTSLDIPPGGRLARLLSEFVDGLPPVAGGYVRVRSTHLLHVVEQFGDFRGTFLSTVGGSPIDDSP